MGSASWPRSGSLSDWQHFGHEDTAVTHNDRMRGQPGSLLDNEPKSAYHPIACVACSRLHFVINLAGKLLGEK
jgi:hypothetical protein